MIYYNLVLEYFWAKIYNLIVNWIRWTIEFDEYIYINIFSLRKNMAFLIDEEEVLYYTHRTRQNKYQIKYLRRPCHFDKYRY